MLSYLNEIFILVSLQHSAIDNCYVMMRGSVLNRLILQIKVMRTEDFVYIKQNCTI